MLKNWSEWKTDIVRLCNKLDKFLKLRFQKRFFQQFSTIVKWWIRVIRIIPLGFSIWDLLIEMFFNLFFCCSLMAFSFLPLTLFGDSECKRRILNFIFRKIFYNFFYICSFFVAPFSNVFFSSHWFLGHDSKLMDLQMQHILIA